MFYTFCGFALDTKIFPSGEKMSKILAFEIAKLGRQHFPKGFISGSKQLGSLITVASSLRKASSLSFTKVTLQKINFFSSRIQKIQKINFFSFRISSAATTSALIDGHVVERHLQEGVGARRGLGGRGRRVVVVVIVIIVVVVVVVGVDQRLVLVNVFSHRRPVF
jgi:hypothetical protein